MGGGAGMVDGQGGSKSRKRWWHWQTKWSSKDKNDRNSIKSTDQYKATGTTVQCIINSALKWRLLWYNSVFWRVVSKTQNSARESKMTHVKKGKKEKRKKKERDVRKIVTIKIGMKTHNIKVTKIENKEDCLKNKKAMERSSAVHRRRRPQLKIIMVQFSILKSGHP